MRFQVADCEREMKFRSILRGNRPFSLDGKLENLETHLPFSPQKMIEVRLLAVQKQHRNKQTFYGLMQFTIGRLWEAGWRRFGSRRQDGCSS